MIRTMILGSCVIVGAVAAMGCGGDKTSGADSKSGSSAAPKAADGGLKGGCDRREKDFLCGEYYGALAKPAWVKEQCSAYHAPFVEACPKEKSVGTCIRDKGTPQETRTTFYEPIKKEGAQALCTDAEFQP